MQTLKNQISTKTPNSKSKKKQISRQKLAKIDEKLSLLAQNLKTFPFVPDPQTIISISTHEKLFRDLNLWDFANLKLDLEIKKDFLTEFIAYYDPIKRFSYVRGIRINLSRADLSRALSLPSKNHKSANLEFNATEFGGADKVSEILWGFILNKMVFLEDAAILPEEVANANNLVKAGSPNKVDWAGLIWILMEKEILDAPSSGYCYYTSHLQHLMKYQKPRLFEEEESSKLEPSEPTVAEDDCVLEEVSGGSNADKCSTVLSLGINVGSEVKEEEDVKFKCSDNYDLVISQCDGKKEMDVDLNDKKDNMDKMVDNVFAEEQDNGEKVEDISKDDELTMGAVDMGKTVNGVADVEFSGFHKRNDDEGNEGGNIMNFELGGLNMKDEDKSNVVNDVMDVEMGGLNEGNDGKTRNDEVGEGKFPNFERLNSSDFMHVMETNNNPLFNESLGQLNRDFFSVGKSDMHDKSVNLEIGQDGSQYFGNEQKRCNDATNDHADELQHKRCRSDQPWEQTPTVTAVDQLSEGIQQVMEKVKMDIVEKERDFTNVSMQIQHAIKISQQKDEIIRTVENNRAEAHRKRGLEQCRFDHDLKHLTNTFYGFKKALKDTQFRFAEYRSKYPIGGENCDNELVAEDYNELVAEDSKQCLEKEKETHQEIRSMTADFSKIWFEKMDNLEKSVSKVAAKLVTIKEQVDALKESVAKAKNQTHNKEEALCEVGEDLGLISAIRPNLFDSFLFCYILGL